MYHVFSVHSHIIKCKIQRTGIAICRRDIIIMRSFRITIVMKHENIHRRINYLISVVGKIWNSHFSCTFLPFRNKIIQQERIKTSIKNKMISLFLCVFLYRGSKLWVLPSCRKKITKGKRLGPMLIPIPQPYSIISAGKRRVTPFVGRTKDQQCRAEVRLQTTLLIYYWSK